MAPNNLLWGLVICWWSKPDIDIEKDNICGVNIKKLLYQ